MALLEFWINTDFYTRNARSIYIDLAFLDGISRNYQNWKTTNDVVGLSINEIGSNLKKKEK